MDNSSKIFNKLLETFDISDQNNPNLNNMVTLWGLISNIFFTSNVWGEAESKQNFWGRSFFIRIDMQGNGDYENDNNFEKQRKATLELLHDFFDPQFKCIVIPLSSSEIVAIQITAGNKIGEYKREEIVSLMRSLNYKIKSIWDSPVVIGIGETGKGMYGTKLSMQDSIVAARIGAHLNRNKSEGVFYGPDYKLPMLLLGIDEEIKSYYIKSVIGNILGNDELIETLDALYTSNWNISEASKILYVHRNTLNYRLQRISDLTGFDPRNFRDAVRLEIALLAQRTLNCKIH